VEHPQATINLLRILCISPCIRQPLHLRISVTSSSICSPVQKLWGLQVFPSNLAPTATGWNPSVLHFRRLCALLCDCCQLFYREGYKLPVAQIQPALPTPVVLLW